MTELIALSVAVLLLIIICVLAFAYAFKGLCEVFSEMAQIKKELNTGKQELYKKMSESLENTERKDKK